MSAPINHQIIEKDGQPLFVVVPYEEYQSLIESNLTTTIPHEVVERHVLNGMSLLRSWREFKKLSQTEVAQRLGISQSAYSQMEKPEANLRQSTIIRLAAALELTPEQLTI